jgi:hypothetical protein
MWRDISTAPKHRAEPGARVSKMLWLLIPYNKPQADIGYWDFHAKCWRFMGDDGPQDIQPTHWHELVYPEVPVV